MKNDRLENMVRGWFVGDFSPTAFSTTACEVAVKKYRAGDSESRHHHKVATEVTLVLSGSVQMGGRSWNEGDIVTLSPGEETDFVAMADAITVVIKTPCVPNDKHLFPVVDNL